MRLPILGDLLDALRRRRLRAAYAAAYEEWEASGDAELWDSVVGDGLEDEDWEEIQRGE